MDILQESSNTNSKSNKFFCCERCKYEATTKGNLIQHLKRKNECPTIHSSKSRQDIIANLTRVSEKKKTHVCSYCELMFSSLQGKHQHMKVCSNNPENELRNKVDNMEKIIEKLKIELQKHIVPSQVHNNIQNQQNINITVNNYGHEIISHLTPEFLNKCLLNPSKGLPSLIEKIHYNPDIPENYNIRHKSTKQNILQKFIDSNWHDCDASNTLDELIKKGYRILNAYYSDHIANDPSIIEDELKAMMYEKFRFLGDKKSIEYSAVKRDLRLLVKDKTIFLLAPYGTQLNPDELKEIQIEIEGALAKEN
jgi:hypothetical protein